MIERKPVKRYSMTMDAKRWDSLSRRSRMLNTSNTAIINQLVEAYLNGPAKLPAAPAVEASAQSSQMIGGTYTAILERLQRIDSVLSIVKDNTQRAAVILEDDSSKLETVAADVDVMAAAFRRSPASKGQGVADRRQQQQPTQPRPMQQPQQTTQPPRQESSSAPTSYTFQSTTPAAPAPDKRDRLQQLAEARARNGFSFLPRQQEEGGTE